MGSLLSVLRNTYLSLRALIQEIRSTSAEFDAVLSRINVPPSLPVPNATTSFWQRDPLFANLTDIQSPALLSKADIVIIGSGITGTSIARTILQQSNDDVRVVMLEARAVTSGATGRNGGHIHSAPYELFAKMQKRFGNQRARKIVQFQNMHLELLIGLGVEAAEVRQVETVDLFMDERGFREAKKMVEISREGIPDMIEDLRVHDREDTMKIFQTASHVYGAVSYFAGALWPYRLVTSVLNSLLSAHPVMFSIETNTPVTKITTSASSTHPYTVHTPRGTISATHVIHATNGHSSTLLPRLAGKIFPVRGQMTAQRPGSLLPAYNGNRSWCMVRSGNLLYPDYMIQRPTSQSPGDGGELLLGGALFSTGWDEVGVANDDSTSFYIGSFLGGVLPKLFGEANWGLDDARGRVKDEWTGIMAFTVDGIPFVGRLEQSLTGRTVQKAKGITGKQLSTVEHGEWISAGYNGDGMVNAWLCGAAVGLMVLGQEREVFKHGNGLPGGMVADWLPDEYLLTKKRLDSASIYELVDL